MATPQYSSAFNRRRLPALAAAALLLFPLAAPVFAVPTEFAYQAQIMDNDTGAPLTSSDVTIAVRLFSSASSAIPLVTQIYPNIDLSGTEGYVNLAIDGNGLDVSQDLYVEVTVDDNLDLQPAEALRPRQKIYSVPYALNTERIDNQSLGDIQADIDEAAQDAYEQAVEDANAYTDQAVAANLPGGSIQAYVEGALDNFNRVVFVNGAITQSAAPVGGLYDPFDNPADAYAYAKTLAGAGDPLQRIIVLLMPGQYTLPATLVLDTPGIDVVGYSDQSVYIQGTVDPLVQTTATGAGCVLSNLQFRATGAANMALEITTSARVADASFARAGYPKDGGYLIEINAPNALFADNYTILMKDIEVYGGIDILSYGDQTTLNDGFILGRLRSTSTVGAGFNETLTINGLSTVDELEFNPPSSIGIISLNNVVNVGLVAFSPATVLRASNTNFFNPVTFVPAILPDPSPGTRVINCVAKFPVGGWTGSVTQSPANIDGHIVYASK